MKPPFPEFGPGREMEDANAKASADEPPVLFAADDEADGREGTRISRLRDVPFRMLVPNLITLGAICSGLTAIRFSLEGRFEFAVIAIVFAAMLDAMDGRVARFLKSATSFGEQLDSLADFVNFGVVPAMVLYIWTLSSLKSVGWIIALFFAICGSLRLARFNVMLEDETRPEWHTDFFTGVPAPAGALLVLLPVYLDLLGFPKGDWTMVLAIIYTPLVGFLMISNIPTWSGKRAGQRVSRSLVLPLMITLMLLVVIAFTYPWTALAVGSVIYLATLPFSYRQWHRLAAEES